MSLKHAILGFLSFKSMSGYDLKKAFDHSVQHFWPANQSQIYRTLSSLNKKGFVTQEVIEREDRLDLKVYHITNAGREELHRWLSTPLSPQDDRNPFLIQLYFGSKLADEELSSLLQHEIQTVEERLSEYKPIYTEYTGKIHDHEDPRAMFLSVLTLEFGIFGNQFLLDWLKSVAQRVEDKDYTLKNL